MFQKIKSRYLLPYILICRYQDLVSDIELLGRYSTVLEVRLSPTTYRMSPDTSYFNKGFIFITLHILFYFITSSTSCMPLAVGRARPSLDDDMGVLLPTLPPSNALPPINKCQFIVFDKELALVSPPAVDVDVCLLNTPITYRAKSLISSLCRLSQVESK